MSESLVDVYENVKFKLGIMISRKMAGGNESKPAYIFLRFSRKLGRLGEHILLRMHVSSNSIEPD